MQRTFSPRSMSTERSLPINNVRYNVPSNIKYRDLWNHRQITDHSICLNASWEKPPKVAVNGIVFTVGLDQLKKLSTTRDSPWTAVEIDLKFDFDKTGERILELHKPIHEESIKNWAQKEWNKFPIVVMFTDQSEDDLNYSFSSQKFEEFARRTRAEENVLSLRHVWVACGRCFVSTRRLDFSLSLAVLATSFTLNAIPYVDIVPSALSKALLYLDYNLFYQKPKTGFIVMDEHLQIHLVMDCDKAVDADISLVGIWVSGVKDFTDLYVWACCARYFHHFHINQEDSDPFMVIVFDNQLKRSSFFDCRKEDCEQSSNMTEFNVYQTFHSANLQKRFLDEQFHLKFNKTILRQTVDKCLNISCFSPKLIRRTPRTSRELSPISFVSSNFGEMKTSAVHRSGRCSGGEIEPCSHSMQLINVIKNKDEIIEDLRSQLDSLRNQTSNSSYNNNNNTNKISTSTMTDESLLLPPPPTIITPHDYDCSRRIEENSEITFCDFQQASFTEESISLSMSCVNIKDEEDQFGNFQRASLAEESIAQSTRGPHFKYEDIIFGEDETESKLEFENSYTESKPYCKAITRKTITKPQLHVRSRDYSELDDLSRFNSSVQESRFDSIVQPSSQLKKADIRFEYSEQFREFANKYKPTNQPHNYDLSDVNYSIIGQTFRNRRK